VYFDSLDEVQAQGVVVMHQAHFDFGTGLVAAPRPEQPTAIARRDEALALVNRHAGDEFRAGVRRVLATMEGDFTAEDIRLACEAAGVKPHHHNAWGGATAGLIAAKLIEPTGERRKMRDPKSKARPTDVYRHTP
jgi:hypothetical protein